MDIKNEFVILIESFMKDNINGDTPTQKANNYKYALKQKIHYVISAYSYDKKMLNDVFDSIIESILKEFERNVFGRALDQKNKVLIESTAYVLSPYMSSNDIKNKNTLSKLLESIESELKRKK